MQGRRYKSTSSNSPRPAPELKRGPRPVALDDLKRFVEISVDWPRFFRLADSIGASLNSRKDRFDKASILELAVAEYSQGRIEWVDKEHHDLEVTDTGMMCRIEMKFGTKMLTQRVRRGFPKTVSARLSNVLGEDSTERQRNFARQFADFLLLADHNRIVVLPKSLVLRNKKFKDDAIVMNVSGRLVAKHVVFERLEQVPSPKLRVCDFHKRKVALMRQVVVANK